MSTKWKHLGKNNFDIAIAFLKMLGVLSDSINGFAHFKFEFGGQLPIDCQLIGVGFCQIQFRFVPKLYQKRH